MIDLAPGWQIRCTKCGRTKPFGRVGIRLGAASKGKWTLAWCTQCRWLRFAAIERMPTRREVASRTYRSGKPIPASRGP